MQEPKLNKLSFDEISIKKRKDSSPNRSNFQEFDELPINNK